MYAAPPKVAAGFSPEDYEDDPIEVWPENLEAWIFFSDSCQTQWRTGMGGATGLDYTAILAALQFEYEKDKAKDLFWQVKQMERGALQAMADARKAEN